MIYFNVNLNKLTCFFLTLPLNASFYYTFQHTKHIFMILYVYIYISHDVIIFPKD